MVKLNKLEAYNISNEFFFIIINIANKCHANNILINNLFCNRLDIQNLSHIINYCDKSKFDIFDYEDYYIKLSKMKDDQHSFAQIT